MTTQDVREVSQGLFSEEASILLCESKAAEFSPNRGRTKITSSGDGKHLAFPYDEAVLDMILLGFLEFVFDAHTSFFKERGNVCH